MKTLTLLVVLVFVRLAYAESQSWNIEGRVLTVIDDGLIVRAGVNQKVGLPKPNPGELVFIKGKFEVTDGQYIGCYARLSGTYHYQTEFGSKTIKAFILSR